MITTLTNNYQPVILAESNDRILTFLVLIKKGTGIAALDAGVNAPDFTLKDLDGHAHSLNSLKQDGLLLTVFSKLGAENANSMPLVVKNSIKL
jgi:hypothetical protein